MHLKSEEANATFAVIWIVGLLIFTVSSAICVIASDREVPLEKRLEMESYIDKELDKILLAMQAEGEFEDQDYYRSSITIENRAFDLFSEEVTFELQDFLYPFIVMGILLFSFIVYSLFWIFENLIPIVLENSKVMSNAKSEAIKTKAEAEAHAILKFSDPKAFD